MAADIGAGLVAFVAVDPPPTNRHLACALLALGDGSYVADLPRAHEPQLLSSSGLHELTGERSARDVVMVWCSFHSPTRPPLGS
eukprot:2994475-Alexandrium_andersonii.AAC.1